MHFIISVYTENIPFLRIAAYVAAWCNSLNSISILFQCQTDLRRGF